MAIVRTKSGETHRAPTAWSRAWNGPHLLGWLLVGPVVAILGGLLAYPFVLGVWLSLTDAYIGRPGRFIGLWNYIDLFEDPVFVLVIFNTFLYTASAVLLKLLLGLALAIVLNREFRGKGLTRAVVLLPWIVPTALSALVFWWMYDATFGIINYMLGWFGIGKINFLGDPNWARFSLIMANVWRGIPFFTIGLLAGLQTISPSLYEAADIDGAGRWTKFRYITFPLLLPITVIVTVFSTIWTFAEFQQVWIITRGGPANATHLFGTLAYQRAIQGGNMGEGAAIAAFIFPVLLLCALMAFWSLRRED